MANLYLEKIASQRSRDYMIKVWGSKKKKSEEPTVELVTDGKNKYLKKIAGITPPVANLKSSVTPVAGIANTVSKGGVKGSVFGKAISPKPPGVI